MARISTFGSFTTARLGVYAAMKGLDVTGHNIANINTPGYTRQSLDQSSLYLRGSDRYSSANDARVGTGVLCTGISQLRDPYLDIRFRNENSSVGDLDAKLAALDELSNILDEVGKGADEGGEMEAAMNELKSRLDELSSNASSKTHDTLVRSASSLVTTLLNNYATRLETIQGNQEKALNQDIDTVNGILNDIRDLNESIRTSDIHGESALDLRDQRNMLIDELSQYVKIDVSYSTEQAGPNTTVQKLMINLSECAQEPLVDGTYVTQFSTNPANHYQFTTDALKDRGGNVTSNPAGTGPLTHTQPLTGSLGAIQRMLVGAGEFSTAGNPYDATMRGIPYYQNALDSMANKFATVFNQANQIYQTDTDGFYVDTDGARINDGGTPPTEFNKATTPPGHADFVQYVQPNGVTGGPLFEAKGGGTITAKNIAIADKWAKGETSVLASSIYGNSTANDNILHMMTLFDAKMDYLPTDTVAGAVNQNSFFSGNFQEMLAGTITSTLGNESRNTSVMLNNHALSAGNLNSSRDSVSSVDLNDEAANMMQYQKSYAAACRLLTTIDEAIDKLINGTGVVGR